MKHRTLRAERREKKKRVTMKVSGKQVIRLHRLIVTKTQKQRIKETH